MPTQQTFNFGHDHIAANDPLFHNKLFRRSQRERDFYGSLSSKRQWFLVMQRAAWHCESCGVKNAPPSNRLTIDHIIPVEAGGDEHCLSNQRALCRQCHNLKTSMDALKYGWSKATML